MGFISSYVGLLKSHPLSTNLGTALVVMTAGDAMAQCIEHSHVVDDPEIENLPENRRINLHRYFTVRVDGHEHGHDRHQSHQHHQSPPNSPQPPPSMWDDGVPPTSTWPDAIEGLASVASELDGARSASMAGWSGLFYTPAYIGIYKFYDRVFPKRTAFTISCRVLGSVAFSVPINAAFFVYGTCVHHVIEWYNDGECGATHELDGRKMLADSKLKIEAELVNTVERSAATWVPINFVNFALVPPHLRPVVLTFCSVFWNCYLSLVQHRDMKMPEGYELELRGEVEGVMVEEENRDDDEAVVVRRRRITEGKEEEEEGVRRPATDGVVVVAAGEHARGGGGASEGSEEEGSPSRRPTAVVAARGEEEKTPPTSAAPRKPPSILGGTRLADGGSAVMASSSARPFRVVTTREGATDDDASSSTTTTTMAAPASTTRGGQQPRMAVMDEGRPSPPPLP